MSRFSMCETSKRYGALLTGAAIGIGAALCGPVYALAGVFPVIVGAGVSSGQDEAKKNILVGILCPVIFGLATVGSFGLYRACNEQKTFDEEVAAASAVDLRAQGARRGVFASTYEGTDYTAWNVKKDHTFSVAILETFGCRSNGFDQALCYMTLSVAKDGTAPRNIPVLLSNQKEAPKEQSWTHFSRNTL